MYIPEYFAPFTFELSCCTIIWPCGSCSRWYNEFYCPALCQSEYLWFSWSHGHASFNSISPLTVLESQLGIGEASIILQAPCGRCKKILKPQSKLVFQNNLSPTETTIRYLSLKHYVRRLECLLWSQFSRCFSGGRTSSNYSVPKLGVCNCVHSKTTDILKLSIRIAYSQYRLRGMR